MIFSKSGFLFWLSSGPRHLKIAGIAILLSLATAFPPLENLPFEPGFYDGQIAHPFTPNTTADPSSFMAKRSMRVTMPVIAHLLHLNASGAYLLELAMSYGLLLVIAVLLLRIFNDALTALLGTSCFALSYVHQGMMSPFMIIWYDGYAFFFLGLSMLFRKSWLMLPFAIAALFCDERAYLSLLFLLFWAILDFSDTGWLEPKKTFMPILSIITALFIRVCLIRFFGLHTPLGNSAGVGPGLLFDGLEYLQLSIISSLKALMLLLAVSVYCLFKAKRYSLLLVFAGMVGLSLLSALLVRDLSRSVAYVFTAVFPALVIINRHLQKKDVTLLLKCSLLINFIIPTSGFISSYIYSVHSPWIRLYVFIKSRLQALI
ncbi:MAG: hypothetical protein V4543_05175 [Bacteroidota bacterium]